MNPCLHCMVKSNCEYCSFRPNTEHSTKLEAIAAILYDSYARGWTDGRRELKRELELHIKEQV